MKFAKISFRFFFCVIFLTSCQWKQLNCKSVRNGKFHFYTDKEQHFLIIRKDTIQLEVNLTTGDTSYWKLKWLSNCDFTAQYISGGRMESKEQEEFFKKMVAQFSIQKVTSQYYVYTGIFKTLKGNKTVTDTTWLKEK